MFILGVAWALLFLEDWRSVEELVGKWLMCVGKRGTLARPPPGRQSRVGLGRWHVGRRGGSILGMVGFIDGSAWVSATKLFNGREELKHVVAI